MNIFCNARRLIAFFIDWIIVLFINWLMWPIIDIPRYKILFFKAPSYDLLLIYFLYMLIFILANQGKTPGRNFMGILIMERNNMIARTEKQIARELVKIFTFPIIFVSVIMMYLRRDRKTLHDLISNTRVRC